MQTIVDEGVIRGAMRTVLMRTSGLMILSTRPRYVRDLEPLREMLRSNQPVESRFSRFELMDSNPEDWRALLRVALKGDVIDVGMTSAGAFDILYALMALGVPQALLGAQDFLAGIIHMQPLMILDDEAPTVGLEAASPDLIERVSMALNGATDGVRLLDDRAAAQDVKAFERQRMFFEVYVPHPQMCEDVQAGRMQVAFERWLALCQETGPARVREQALHEVARGRMDPRRFEQELGPIHWDMAIKDRVVQGYELM